MLGRLLKYELRATSRIMLPLYGALIVLSAIVGTFLRMREGGWILEKLEPFQDILQGLFTLLYAVVLIGTIAFTLILLVQRFYKNLLGDEGYLMFTLPVPVSTNIVAKMLVSMLWIFASAIGGGFSGMIIASSQMSFAEMFQSIDVGIRLLNHYLEGYLGLAVFYAIVLVILSSCANILLIYASIAIGHLSGKRRMLTSFGAYLGLSFVAGFFTSLVMQGVSILVDFSALEAWIQSLSVISAMNLIILCLALAEAFFAAVYFFITRVILVNRLNIE